MKRVLIVIAALGMVVALVGVATAEGPPRQETEPVMWHAQSGESGIVEGAQARLRATDSGASVTFQTRDLQPGHAYTLWFVFVNNPEDCDDTPCTARDILSNPDVDAQVTYGAGNVVGESGRSTFSAHLNAGPVEGWLPDRELTGPRTAEYHFVINDHGPKLSEFMPDMIQSYRGGCSDDDSPFPGIFPETALADGEPGPNTCLLYQNAIFMP